MKLPLIGAGVVLGLSLCGAAMAAQSTDADATSGVADSTVMTQTQAPKAVKKQKAEVTKGGRPLSSTSSSTSKSGSTSSKSSN
ncbi:hypothetical protein [Pseudomonas huanghezhanensis]|uniref:hypothetical protein n=1 Tax=Pseudomonas huanghezhanensis TaxID=3002903 RepID=UPI002285F308|nr:hypothetical protein [Pseudomonas sp. BSw22131]